MSAEVPDKEFWFVDKDGCSWTSTEEYLFVGVLGGCGCGLSKEIGEDVMLVFEAIAAGLDNTDARAKSFELIYKDRYHELIAHWLDSRDLTDHGTSIAGGWLTKKGEGIWAEVLAGRELRKSLDR